MNENPVMVSLNSARLKSNDQSGHTISGVALNSQTMPSSNAALLRKSDALQGGRTFRSGEDGHTSARDHHRTFESSDASLVKLPLAQRGTRVSQPNFSYGKEG